MIMEMKLVPIEKRLKIPQKSGLLKRKNKSRGYSLCHSMLNMKGKTFYGAMLMFIMENDAYIKGFSRLHCGWMVHSVEISGFSCQ